MPDHEKSNYSRRDFLKTFGATATGVYVATVIPGKLLGLSNGVLLVSASEGYLLIDTKKCQGCVSCMLACSLVHEGVESLSMSRIQILQSPHSKFPDDITIAQCRQCTDPLCVKACPSKALHVDKANGNIRTVDDRKCIGCMKCIEACPFTPSRLQWNMANKHSQKCDLCADTPYHWDKNGGGPDGKQACVSVCPVGAIAFSKEIPEQKEDGYEVNLRGLDWKKLRYPAA